MEIGLDNLPPSTGPLPMKHPAGADGNPDENDNETSVKRIRTSEEGPVAEGTEKGELGGGGGDKKPDEDCQVSSRPTEVHQKQRLDVPSKELQCIQKQVLIERLMTSPSTGSASVAALDNKKVEEMETESAEISAPSAESDVKAKSNKSFKKPSRTALPQPRKTFRLQSSLLSNVKSFLVEMKTANEELLKLPDPSKISLESDSDFDEMDGAKPGTSAAANEKDQASSSSKTFVEMNIALVDHSDSDTSSDDESFQIVKKNKSSLSSSMSSSSKKVTSTKEEEAEKTSTSDKEAKEESGMKNLITELN